MEGEVAGISFRKAPRRKRTIGKHIKGGKRGRPPAKSPSPARLLLKARGARAEDRAAAKRRKEGGSAAANAPAAAPFDASEEGAGAEAAAAAEPEGLFADGEEPAAAPAPRRRRNEPTVPAMTTRKRPRRAFGSPVAGGGASASASFTVLDPASPGAAARALEGKPSAVGRLGGMAEIVAPEPPEGAPDHPKAADAFDEVRRGLGDSLASTEQDGP